MIRVVGSNIGGKGDGLLDMLLGAVAVAHLVPDQRHKLMGPVVFRLGAQIQRAGIVRRIELAGLVKLCHLTQRRHAGPSLSFNRSLRMTSPWEARYYHKNLTMV